MAGAFGGGMAGAGMRERRTCVRCGRVGFNAFQPVSAADRRTWACTHVDTCVERARLRRRSQARRAGGRPATSSIAPTDLTDRPACVIGSNSASVAQLQKLLTGVAGIEVECLPLTIRSLDIVSRRDFGLVVFDAQATDSIALLNELGCDVVQGWLTGRPMPERDVAGRPSRKFSGSVPNWMLRPDSSATARSTMFSSSRTLPGHG